MEQQLRLELDLSVVGADHLCLAYRGLAFPQRAQQEIDDHNDCSQRGPHLMGHVFITVGHLAFGLVLFMLELMVRDYFRNVAQVDRRHGFLKVSQFLSFDTDVRVG